MRCQCGVNLETTASFCPQCGSPVGIDFGSDNEVQKGTIVFDKYETIRLLGSGGMGQVYLARDIQLERMIALKTLSREFSNDEEHKSRFIREARMASALNHPNILTVFEIGSVGQTLFMATEYVEGQTLRQLVRGGGLSIQECLDISIQAVQGLAAAHGAGIIHRDLKLENFILRSDGYLKILDFGLAKTSTSMSEQNKEDSFKTKTGIILGTPNYMSPEQAKGKELDARSDIFSFGAVLYELLTNRLAFEADTDMQVLFNVVFKQPDPIPDSIPSSLRDIVKRALQKDLESRYQSMQLLLQDLLACRDGLQGGGQLQNKIRGNTGHLSKLTLGGRMMPTEIRSRMTALTEKFDSSEPQALVNPEYDQFVGRDVEMTILKSELQRSSDGKSRPTLILGDSGSGKTQMLMRFRRWAKDLGAVVGIASFFDRGSSITLPYQTLANLLAALLDIRDTDQGASKEIDLNRRVVSQVKTQFSVELPSSFWERTSNSQDEAEKWQVFEQLRQLLTRLAQDKPVVLLFDNLHWADELSLELLGYILRNLSGVNLTIVATAGDEEAAKAGTPLREWLLAQSRYISFQQIKLKPFTAVEVRAMLEAIFRRIEISPYEINRITEATSGNIYYIVEVIRLLVQHNKIVLNEGWWRCESLQEMILPSTLNNAVEYKLEKCSEALRELLSQASVIGESFQFELLAELADQDEEDLEKLLNEGVKAYLIHEERGSRSDDYRFNNATIQHMLYEGLSKRQRRRLHSKAASAIQKVYKGKLSRFLGALAYHYTSAGEWSEALNYCCKVIAPTLAQDAWGEVVKYSKWLAEALAAIEESPEDFPPIDKVLLAEALAKCSLASVRLGQVDESMAQAEAAFKIGQELHNDRLIAISKTRLCESGWYQGRFSTALKYGEEGLVAAHACGDTYSESYLHFFAGLVSWRTIGMAAALNHLTRGTELARASQDYKLLPHGLLFCGVVNHCRGNWRTGWQYINEGYELAKKHDKFVQGRAYSVMAVQLYYERRHQDMLALHTEGLEFMRTIGWRIGEAYLHILLAFDYTSPTNLNIQQAWDYMQRGFAICQETGEKGFQLLATRGFGRLATITGEYDQAIAKLQGLLGLLRQIGDRFEEVAALCYLGEALEGAGKVEEALKNFELSFSIAQDMVFLFWQWQALYGQARCLKLLGRDREAISKLSAACAIIVKLRKEFDSEAAAANFITETQEVYDALNSWSAD